LRADLAENGCLVLVPTLINREDTWSGNERLDNRPEPISGTKQSSISPISRIANGFIGSPTNGTAYHRLRGVKIQAAVDWFDHEAQSAESKTRGLKTGVVGTVRAGFWPFTPLLWITASRLLLVSGYFDSRQHIWDEPIYRNIFGLLHEFGDAEVASLVAPRSLIVEYSAVPKVEGPPKPRDGRSGAAPGRLKTPDYPTLKWNSSARAASSAATNNWTGWN